MNIISAFFRPTAFKAVDAISGLSVWQKLFIESVEILDDSATAESPVSIKGFTNENLVIDSKDVDSKNAKVIKPTKLRIKAITADQTTVESLIRYFVDVTSTLNLSSKEFTVDNVCLTNILIDQSPQVISADVISIEFEQTKKTASDQFDPAQPSDEPTFGSRIQDPSPVSTGGVASIFTSAVDELYNKVSSYIG